MTPNRKKQQDPKETAYKLMYKALNRIALMKCTCNDKYPCPSAKAFMTVCEVDEIVPKPNRRKK